MVRRGSRVRVPERALTHRSGPASWLRCPAVRTVRDAPKLDAKYQGILQPAQLAELKQGLDSLWPILTATPGHLRLDITKTQNDFVQRYYSNVLARTENSGHRFGEGLSERDKQALTAFLATL